MKIGVIIATLLFALTAAAMDVTLQWTPSISTNVGGYKIYYGGASGNYTNTIDAGNVTNAVLSNLATNTTYYFAATAYYPTNIEDGAESQFSNEVVWPPTTYPGGMMPFRRR